MKKAAFIVITLVGCSSPRNDFEAAQFDDFSLAVPSGWVSKDLTTRQRRMIEWQPVENPRKESVSVSRSERPAVASAGTARLQQLIAQAQRTLPSGRFSSPMPFATTGGLVGVRIDGEFTLSGQTTPYRRFHATLIDGTGLVNVMYTARDPDPAAFEVVVNTLVRKGA